jgi:transcriptional regulator with XRE-family HTH domain
MEQIADFKIGSKIKKIRELRNYTQEYMAEQLGMSQTGYGNIERDETDITMKRLNQIVTILAVRVQDLLGFDENKALVGTIHNNHNTNGTVFNNENFERERRLYEEQISLLKDQVNLLKEELVFVKTLLNK